MALGHRRLALGLVVMLDSRRRPQNRDPQIAADVFDGLRSLARALHDVLDVSAGQLVQLLPDGLGALELLPDLLALIRAGIHFHHRVQKLIQLLRVVPLGQYVELQLSAEALPQIIQIRALVHQSIRFLRIAQIDRFP